MWPAFYGSQFLSRNKLLVGTWLVVCVVMSSFTLLPAIKVEDINLVLVRSLPTDASNMLTLMYRLSGGIMMALIGVLYLIFEKRLLKRVSLAGDSSASVDDALSRSLIGIQVSFAQLRS